MDSRPTCSTCIHAEWRDVNAGYCTCLPPTAQKHLIPVQVQTPIMLGGANSHQPQTQLQEMVSGTWPPIQRQMHCGAHPDFAEWYTSHKSEIRQQQQNQTQPNTLEVGRA